MQRSEENQYLSLIDKLVSAGDEKHDRTGVGTFAQFGKQLRFDISNRKIPIVTTRKLKPLDPIIEMLWFIAGDTDIAFLKENKINIWDSWVREDTKRYDDEGKLVGGSIGPGAYGAQWRNWEDTRIIDIIQLAKYSKFGYSFVTALNDSQMKEGSKKCVITRNIDQLATAIEQIKNSPDSRRIIVSAWNPARIEDQALPPCFLGNTMVSTPNGYKEISEIKEGDEVYTASMAVKKVRQVWKTPYKKGSPLVGLVSTASPHPLISTPNHPHLLMDGDYVKAEDINTGDFLTIPTLPQCPEPKPYSFKFVYHIAKSNEDREYEATLTVDDYYSLGYFVGNGWFMENSRNRICVAIPEHKKSIVLDKFRKTVKVAKKNSHSNTVSTYETRSLKWAHVFKQCGHLAPNKEIPEWVFSSPTSHIQSFFDGFIEADGYVLKDGYFNITTTSYKLALGLQRLAGILNYRCTVKFQRRPDRTIIEGREVNQNSTYHVRVTPNLGSYEKNIRLTSKHLYSKVNTFIPYEINEDTFVYNLDVEDEHTYIVDNFATHNCHSLYQFYTYELTHLQKLKMIDTMLEFEQLPADKLQGLREFVHKTPAYYKYALYGTVVNTEGIDEAIQLFSLPSRGLKLHLFCRSQDVCVGTAYNTLQYASLAHMVAQVTNTWATEFIWTASDVHIYKDQLESFSKQKTNQALGDDIKLLINPGVISIDGFKPEDFQVLNYEHHPFIKYPIAV